MRLSFGPGEDTAFDEARDRLLVRFRAWAAERGVPVSTFVVTVVLDHIYAGGDGHLTRITDDGLRGTLLVWFPRSVAMRPRDWPMVPETLHAWADFLADTGMLDPGSDPVPVLHAALEEVTRPFLDAMEQHPSYATGRYDDPGAPEAEPVTATYAPRRVEGSGDPFGDAPGLLEQTGIAEPVAFGQPPFGRALEPGERAASFPPVKLPTAGQVAEAAAASPTLSRLVALTRWLGEGRQLTAAGHLRLADAREAVVLLDTGDVVDGPNGTAARVRSSAELPGLARALRWARAAGFVRTVKGRLVPVRRSGLDLDDPPRAWRRAFEALPELAAATAAATSGKGDGPRLPGLGTALRETAEAVLAMLYACDGPVAASDVRDSVCAALCDDAPAPRTAGIPPPEVPQAVSEPGAARRGVVWRAVVQAEVVAIIEELAGLGALDSGTGTVTLTPLGVWATRRHLAALGYHVPVLGDFADAPASAAVAAAATYDDDHADAELDRWCAARPQQEAAEELARLAASTHDQAACVVALRALTRLGPGGLDAVARLRGDTTTGRYAAVLLLTEGALDPGEITAEESNFLRVETLVATAQQGGAAALLDELADLGSVSSTVAFLGEIRRCGHPALPHLLDVVAARHPEPAVAKAARKVRFQLAGAAGGGDTVHDGIRPVPTPRGR